MRFPIDVKINLLDALDGLLTSEQADAVADRNIRETIELGAEVCRDGAIYVSPELSDDQMTTIMVKLVYALYPWEHGLLQKVHAAIIKEVDLISVSYDTQEVAIAELASINDV